ncbi:hypothetical protein BX070DRAFT_228371 [Coemansia spiralis]|nr:hypothetical protein BX070DRAFT_228371 [Coemansia spiralis]
MLAAWVLKEGIDNVQISMRYCREILQHGSRRDSMVDSVRFLRCKPSSDALFKQRDIIN